MVLYDNMIDHKIHRATCDQIEKQVGHRMNNRVWSNITHQFGEQMSNIVRNTTGEMDEAG